LISAHAGALWIAWYRGVRVVRSTASKKRPVLTDGIPEPGRVIET